jgi:PAS domain S-box-containing protein
MIALDIRTLFFSSIVLMTLNAFVMFPVWWQNRERSPETALWLVNALLQLVAAVLFTLRGSIPDFASVIVANAMVLGGTIILIVGLERYVDRRSSQLVNYACLTVYLLIQSYFTLVRPDLTVRNINFSIAMIVITLQAAWLLLRRVGPALRQATRGPGIVFLGFALVGAVRIFFEVFGTHPTDLLESGLPSALALIGLHVLSVALTLSLLLMVNRRLTDALKEDITERELAETALVASKDKFSTAFHTSPDAVNINRLSDGLYLDVNEGFTTLTGFTPEDVSGKTSADIQIWNDTADRDRLVAGLLADGVVNNLEAVFRRKDGTLTTALMSARIVEVEGERCILSVTRDISERRAAEQALLASEEWHRAILHTAMDGFWLLDEEGRLLEVNETYCRMSGYSESELLGMCIADLEAAMDADAIASRIPEIAADGEARFESQHRRKDGSVFDVEVNVQYRPDAGGRLVAFLQDITERKRVEEEVLRLNEDLELRVQERTEELTATNEELIEANARLDEATHAKSDFLASMSHELRTPLNSIIGFSHILSHGMAGALDSEQEKQVRMIHSSGKHLLELVNQILDVSAIEAGRMKVEQRPLEVAAVVKSVAETVAPLAAEKGLELSWSVAPDVGVLLSDHTRLEQVLLNVMGNAIKFTESGSVRVEAKRVGDGVAFIVADTGCGIAHDDLPRVFEEFYQVERDDVAKSEGTGLGLTVSKRLLDLLGGTIEVESTPGEGSTFTVRLPLSV